MEAFDFNSTIEWYNQNAVEYAEEIEDVATDQQIAEFSNLLKKGDTVLDHGCAAGRDTNKLAEAGLKPIGLDLSNGLINEARKRFPKISFIQGNFLEMPFENNSFDGIWAHMSLVHLESFDDVTKAFSEISRILSIGGVLHLQVKAQIGAEKTLIKSDLKSGQKRFFRYFTLEEINNLLEPNLQIIELNQFHESDVPGTLRRPDVDLIIARARKK